MSQARAEHVSGSKTLLVRPSVSVSLSLSVSVVLSISLARAVFSSRCALCQRGGFDLRQTGKQASTSLRCACGGMVVEEVSVEVQSVLRRCVERPTTVLESSKLAGGE